MTKFHLVCESFGRGEVSIEVIEVEAESAARAILGHVGMTFEADMLVTEGETGRFVSDTDIIGVGPTAGAAAMQFVEAKATA